MCGLPPIDDISSSRGMGTFGASSISSIEAASDLFGGEAQASTKLRRGLEHVARWPSGDSELRDGRKCGFFAPS